VKGGGEAFAPGGEGIIIRGGLVTILQKKGKREVLSGIKPDRWGEKAPLLFSEKEGSGGRNGKRGKKEAIRRVVDE